MRIFGKIKDFIFGKAKAAPAPASPEPAAPSAQVPPASAPPATTAAAPAPVQAAAPEAVDVAAILEALAAEKTQTLNWRTSIVDLLKLLDMDSSLSERRELADELGYTGDKGDSATMNIWLHKQVLRKLAENGGKVPSELLD